MTIKNEELRARMARALKAIELALKHAADEKAVQEIRKRFREAHGLIYVREYTVHSHMRVRKPRRR